MGCLSGPKKVQASESERELASMAREKYAYGRGIVDPLQARERAEANRLGSKGVRQLTVNRAVNSARESIPAVQGNPNQKRTLAIQDGVTSNVLSRAAASGEDVATRMHAGKKLQNLSQGLQLSISGSQGMRRKAASDAGLESAQSAAEQYVADSRAHALGQAVGAVGTAGAYKAGWFDPKPEV
ncbi:MAG: hypothetical protein Q8N34_03165 [Gammaproteobacteria bacterium]|nr:hypothetical protein [Gammaproteobacteria bacterium]